MSSPIPAIPALISLLALITYQATALLVGRARIRHGVRPPATSGPEEFERSLRVQQNTLEQLVFFLPVFWLAVLFSNGTAVSVLGLIWVGGRIAYAVGYLQAPEKRGPGFGISFLSGVVLLVMAVVGAVRGL
jgi:glutathione S-transferase